jgi:formamidopyrimidine-DNA glycosylase
MPELPEVETVTTELRNHILGKRFTDVHINRYKLRITIPAFLSELVNNQKITKIQRQAKYILIYLDNEYVLVLHLGMSGKILINPKEPSRKHDHVIFTLNNNHKIIFNDPRRFGLVTIIHNLDLAHSKLFAKLGPEPLSSEFNSHYLLNAIKKRVMPIKTTIMNNQVVVGVGNIYACESLFRCGISPLRKANTLTVKEVEKLVVAIQQTLQDAITAGGSSLKDYVNTSGDAGYFQNNLRVYGKANQLCDVCNTIITNIRQSGRSTFYCYTCQC